MRISLFILLFIFLQSCTEKKYLADDLKSEIINFQTKHPLTQLSEPYKFYVVRFFKKENDTVFRVSRMETKSKAIFDNYKIFNDNELEPTVIFDPDSLAKQMIFEFPRSKRDNLIKHGRLETIKPVYLYHIKNSKIDFIKEEDF